MTAEPGIGMLRVGGSAQAKECRQLLEAGKGEDKDSSLEPPEGTQWPANPFSPSYPQTVREYICCFQPLNLWRFVTATTEGNPP